MSDHSITNDEQTPFDEFRKTRKYFDLVTQHVQAQRDLDLNHLRDVQDAYEDFLKAKEAKQDNA